MIVSSTLLDHTSLSTKSAAWLPDVPDGHPARRPAGFDRIVGTSEAMLDVLDQTKRAAERE
jgi:hypothetical protein